MFASLLNDVRYALRQLRRSPGFTVTAALTLAIGIGAATAIFSLIWSIMLKPLPVTHPEQLYKMGKKNDCCNYGGIQTDWSIFSYELYTYFRDHTPGFESLAAVESGQDAFSMRREGDRGKPQIVGARYVSGNYFSTLGVPILRGRPVTPEDDREGASPVAVISYRFWQQRFALDPSLVGGTLLINGKGVTVVGVTRPEFYGEKLSSDPPSLWVPVHQEANITTRLPHLGNPDRHWLDIVGRVPPGTNLANLEAQLNVELKQWLQSRTGQMRPEERAAIGQQRTELAPAAQSANNIGDQYGQGLKLLMYAALAVLFIVCANVAGLMLVRATARKQQIAVCMALGARRSEVVRQTLAISVVIALIGGLGALAVTYATTNMMLVLAFHWAEYVPIDAYPSLPVLAFAFLVSLITGIVFGSAPAWFSSQANPVEALRGANRSSTRDASSRPQQALVVLQAALSVVLLCTAGLLIRSLQNLEHQHFGFQTQDRVIVGMNLAMAGVRREDLDAFYQRVRDRLGRIPGVVGVSYALYAPMSFNNWSTSVFIPGQPDPKPESDWYKVSYLSVGPDYFKAIGSAIEHGRPITEEDNDHSRHVAVVNETFAHKYYKGDAIGQHFGMDPELRSQFEIVGVAEDTKYKSPNEPTPPMYFVPIAQTVQIAHERDRKDEATLHYAGNIVLQFQGNGEGREQAVRSAMADVNPNLAPLYVHTFDEQVGRNLTSDDLLARLTSLFGLTALVLASIGLYGVTAYSVERRTSEIGIRMALGADRMAVLKNVMSHAMAQALLGLAIGIPLAYAVGRYLVGHVAQVAASGPAVATVHMYQVAAFDPVIVAVSVASLAAAATIAALLPARRAASVNPIEALRTE
jgi:predicted permease